ncbi:DUF1801 domain-containing protein [Winogradskyella aurantiaca]|uniref:DUF1801 domain-containing protein n=1 Tax=Winogradskyella aurantiaca TaxID=2219558 RepID=UPI000E1CB3EF|nr:DUF1801 domain-containing protein [Winogradskyella aurantiaca]
MNPAEAYILKQPEPYKSIMLHVQLLIEHAAPEADMMYKWSIPCFYIGKKPICYINQSKDFVDIGFYHSKYMTKYQELMVSEKRKLVRSLRYKQLEDINDEVLLFVIDEARQHVDKPLLG